MEILHGKLTRALVAAVVMCGAVTWTKGAEEAGTGSITTAQQAIQALQDVEIIHLDKRKGARISSSFLEKDDINTQEVSKELMAHYDAFQQGRETLKDYPYIETIIQLFKCRQNKQVKFPTGALEPFYAAGCQPKGITRLAQACYRPRPEIEINAMLKVGVNPNEKDADEENALHTATRCKLGAPILEMMIKAGADINAANKVGFTPLHLATQAGADAQSLRTLLKAGADPKAQSTKENLIPVMAGMESCSPETIRAMMEAGLDLNAKNQNLSALINKNALYILGMESITAEELALFLKAGCDINETMDRTTPTIEMAGEGDEKLIRALVAARANFSTANYLNRNSLHYLVLNRKITTTMLEMVLREQSQAASTAADNYGRTALHYIMTNDKATPDMIDILLKKQLNVNQAESSGQTPLHFGVRFRASADKIKKLLNAGANKELRDSANKTALDVAREMNRTDIIKLLSD